MKLTKLIAPLVMLAASAASTASEPFNDSPEQKALRTEQLLTAYTTQIDTGFPYYQNRSAESIASELELNGFNGVYYFVISPASIVPGLIAELQSRNIPVALMTLPAMVYVSEADLDRMLPPNWREWLVEFTDNSMDTYRFIGFNYPEYNEWYKKYLNKILLDNNFDGFTFAEVMYPITDGPERKVPFYGDVSKNFQKSFMAATGNTEFPDFKNPDSPNYFKTNKKLYNDLVEYRVQVINDFYNDIINGKNGAREAVPDIKFASWTLGINIPDGVNKLRTWEGNDIAAMMKLVKPDMHFIQTHAPDWANPALPATYPEAYMPFFDAIRNANPNVKVALQADLGSLTATRRDPEWCKTFYESCRKAGVDSTTYYEFGLRWKIYNAAPELKQIRTEGNTVKLCFDQRLGADSAKIMTGRLVGRSRITAAKIDGNMIIATVDKPLEAGKEASINVSGVCDDPQVRFGGDQLQLNTVPENSVIRLMVK